MKLAEIHIKNFKSIADMKITDIHSALILVGRNNTGKTAILEAIGAVGGAYLIKKEDFLDEQAEIEIGVTLEISESDLSHMMEHGLFSRNRDTDAWLREFCETFPSYKDGRLNFRYLVNRDGKVRYEDGVSGNNPDIPKIFPKVFYVDAGRNIDLFQDHILRLKEGNMIRSIREGRCLLDPTKKCSFCFSCMDAIFQKSPEELDAGETAKLLDYKLYQLNLNEFENKVNDCFQKNGGLAKIRYTMNRDVEKMLQVTTEVLDPHGGEAFPKGIHILGRGMRSVYMLSLLEAYGDENSVIPGIILIEEPELFLHPSLQKTAGNILYDLSKNNQVIFSTHSPNLLSDFNTRQIRQIILDEEGYSVVRKNTNISLILDDLGYSAGDLMNIDFVFIVEGRQDKSRLPLLLRKYYSEVYDENGKLSRVAIITTNSCTNIKTYANLKYINQIYLKDNFLMIRDGDGKDKEMLKHQLVGYYEERKRVDADGLPGITEDNVLILKYYSFENYFLNPEIMAKIGVIHSPEEFYTRFLKAWKEYLNRTSSGMHLKEVLGKDLKTVDDVKAHMEEIKIYVRGHNLFDLFYGKFKKKEYSILKKYIEVAPKEEFQDIFDAIEHFIYFENRLKNDVLKG